MASRAGRTSSPLRSGYSTLPSVLLDKSKESKREGAWWTGPGTIKYTLKARQRKAETGGSTVT